jgi:hypothetical protein
MGTKRARALALVRRAQQTDAPVGERVCAALECGRLSLDRRLRTRGERGGGLRYEEVNVGEEYMITQRSMCTG